MESSLPLPGSPDQLSVEAGEALCLMIIVILSQILSCGDSKARPIRPSFLASEATLRFWARLGRALKICRHLAPL